MLNARGEATRATVTGIGGTLADTVFDLSALGEVERATRLAEVPVVTSVVRDAGRRAVAGEDARRLQTHREYDGADRLEKVTGSDGSSVTLVRDADDFVRSVTEYEVAQVGTSGADKVTARIPDELGRLKCEIGPLGDERKQAFDSLDQTTVVQDAFGLKTRTIYNIHGEPVETRQEVRDATGTRLVVTTRTFTDDGLLASVTDDNGHTASYEYDGQGRRTVERFADGTERRTAYSAAGDPIRIEDANGTVTVQSFDLAHRMTRRDIAPGAGVEGETFQAFEYDGLGRMTRAENDWSVVTMAYNELGQLTEETLTVGGRTYRTVPTLDAAGNLTGLTYPSGLALTLTPDASMNRLDTVRDGAGLIVSYDYKGPYRSGLKTFGNGVATSLDYDEGRRLTGVRTTHPSLPAASPIEEYAYGYDLENNRVFERATHPGGLSYAATLDQGLYRLRNVKYGVTPTGVSGSAATSSGTPTREVDYDLDGVGNRKSVFDNHAGIAVYSFNAVNQYTRVGGVDRTLDANGNFLREGTNEPNRFDWQDRLVRMPSVTQRRNLSYRTSTALPLVTADSLAAGFAGDALNDLRTADSVAPADVWASAATSGEHTAQVDWPAAQTVNEVELWFPTAYGLPTRFAVEILPPTIPGFPVPAWAPFGPGTVIGAVDAGSGWFAATDRRVVFRAASAIPAIAVRFRQDASGGGAMVPGQAWVNEFTVYKVDAAEVTDKYDAIGRRLTHRVANPGMGTATEQVYVYHGQDLIEEYDDAGNLRKRFVHGSGVDEPLRMEVMAGAAPLAPGGAVLYLHANALGSITALTDAGGAVVERVRYDVYGQPEILDAAGNVALDPDTGEPAKHSLWGNPFLFTGREWDGRIGLYHYRARTLDPRTGAFLSRDKVEGANRFGYAGGNPNEMLLSKLAGGTTANAILGMLGEMIVREAPHAIPRLRGAVKVAIAEAEELSSDTRGFMRFRPRAVSIDWDHLFERHSQGGQIAQDRLAADPSYMKYIFENLTQDQVKASPSLPPASPAAPDFIVPIPLEAARCLRPRTCRGRRCRRV